MVEIYFEDFQVGQVYELGSYTVSEEQILTFAREFDPQPFHVDSVLAAESIYGGIIASGLHTASIFMRLLYDGLLCRSASMGSPGQDELRWLRPVRPGDTLTARGTVEELIPSKSKPDRGLVRKSYEVLNQHGEKVMTMRGLGMFGRRSN
ncbi:MAG: dehydratase [Rhodospirillaceae bacterium]|jgi:acyl dehydratase|nr:dehydratase [Rhodospirillaceae bacterium]|tara:strand:+ start:68 stop:517 length:450 start_codon:yes stop_codon:yes gene_type:complete